MMSPSVLTVARHGKQWSVSSEGKVLVVARTKQAARDLADSAAQILRDSGGPTEVRVAAEPRSFSAD
jgi:hypothetical protein